MIYQSPEVEKRILPGYGKNMAQLSGKFFRTADYFKDELPIVVLHNVQSPASFFPPESLNRRQFWKILYVVSGTGVLKINHREYPFGPGFVCLNHPDDLTNLVLDAPIESYSLLFLLRPVESELAKLYSGNHFFSIFRPEFRPEQSISHNLLHLIDSNRKLYLGIRRIHHECTHVDANSVEMLRYLLLELLVEFSRQSSLVFSRRRRQDAVGYLEKFLREHYAERFDSERAAREVGMSKNYLFDFYRRATGRTIGNTLLAIRIEEVKKLIAGGMRIETACYRCGFSDLSNFYRVFRRETGLPPGAFRPGEPEPDGATLPPPIQR